MYEVTTPSQEQNQPFVECFFPFREPRFVVMRKHIFHSEYAMNTLLNWIYIGSNAYVEYTFVPWLGRNVYRRTVDLRDICIQ